LLDNWGYLALAKQWRKESIEEMQHADKLIERIIFLDASPNMQTLDSLHIGHNVKEVLDSDLAAELSARSLYQEAATHCHNVKDYVSRDLFEELMADEEHHIDFLETQIDLVGKLGARTIFATPHRKARVRRVADRRQPLVVETQLSRTRPVLCSTL
jgi:bacterioferritin